MRFKFMLVCCALCAGTSAMPLIAGADTITIERLDHMQSDYKLLQMELAQEKLKKELHDLKHPATAVTVQQAEPGEALPNFKTIEGFGGHLMATLVFSGGTTITASSGDMLPGGYRVAAITHSGVIVSRGVGRKRRLIKLRMLAPTPAQAVPTQTTGMPMPMTLAPMSNPPIVPPLAPAWSR